VLIAGDEAIGDVFIHQPPASGQARRGDVRAICRNVPRPLIMDSFRPAGLIQVRQSESHQQIAERSRIQHTRVIKDDLSHGSVAHIKVLAQALEFVERSMTPGLAIPFVGE
jgi:hypothetical protein